MIKIRNLQIELYATRELNYCGFSAFHLTGRLTAEIYQYNIIKII